MKNPRLLLLIFASILLVVLVAKNGNRYFPNYVLLLPALLLSYLIRREAATQTPEEIAREMADGIPSSGFPFLRCFLAFFIPCGISFAYFGPHYMYQKYYGTLTLLCVVPASTFLIASLPDGKMTDGQKLLKKMRVVALFLLWGFLLLLVATICGLPMKQAC